MLEREFIAERQRALHDWLVSLLATPDLSACLLVRRFLDPTNYTASFQGRVAFYRKVVVGHSLITPRRTKYIRLFLAENCSSW